MLFGLTLVQTRLLTTHNSTKQRKIMRKICWITTISLMMG